MSPETKCPRFLFIFLLLHAIDTDGVVRDGLCAYGCPYRLFPFIGSDQERFRFAKAAIDLRKRTRGNGGAVETVVLAFGGHNSGSAVHVTRKTRKRQLFKVG